MQGKVDSLKELSQEWLCHNNMRKEPVVIICGLQVALPSHKQKKNTGLKTAHYEGRKKYARSGR